EISYNARLHQQEELPQGTALFIIDTLDRLNLYRLQHVDFVDNAAAETQFAVIEDDGLPRGDRFLWLIEDELASAISLSVNSDALIWLTVAELGGATIAVCRCFP